MQICCFGSFQWGMGGVLLVVVLTVGCASSEQTMQPAPEGRDTPTTQEEPADKPESSRRAPAEGDDREVEPKKVLRLPEIRERIEEVAQDWMGVPYEWGGESKQGVDCSALVQTLFYEAFDRRLPRVTELQVQAGSTVTRPQLRPGDLVFFRPEDQYNHVGLYLGDKTFIHASSREGVTTAPIDTNYWRRYYWTSRRILGPSEVPDSLASELIAYQYPDSTAQGLARGTTPEETANPSSGEAPQDVQVAAMSDSTSIRSCADPDVQCSSSQEGRQDTTLAPADTVERKGW